MESSEYVHLTSGCTVTKFSLRANFAREPSVMFSILRVSLGAGIEPAFSDPKSDVLPVRRPPKQETPKNVCLSGFHCPEGRRHQALLMSRRAKNASVVGSSS